MKSVGFIILRHVTNIRDANYWQYSYSSIRNFYPEHPILIIDDNSNYEYIMECPLYKTTIIQSEYPKRGELLPYYYFLHNKLFDIAVIIHDSVFVNTSSLDFQVDTYKFIWMFTTGSEDSEKELDILNIYNDKELIKYYNKKEWLGCFGGMSIINHDHLTYINNLYPLHLLLDKIVDRDHRMYFERIIAVLLQKNSEASVLLGDIALYCLWGTPIEKVHSLFHLPFIKVWSGR